MNGGKQGQIHSKSEEAPDGSGAGGVAVSSLRIAYGTGLWPKVFAHEDPLRLPILTPSRIREYASG